MQRLMEDFSSVFDLDARVDGDRLGDLVESAIGRIESSGVPDWGSKGPVHRREFEQGESFAFYYSPHLFPGMELHLRLAHKLQFHMLPREVPNAAPVSIAAVLESYCHLSGDLFGWEMLADGQFLFWIVDMSGHGVRAGIASAVLKILTERLRERSRVGSFVTELNDTFVESLRRDSENLYATGFFMALSPDGSAHYASAGHPPVLLRKSDGRLDDLSPTDIPIGMFPDRRFEAAGIRLDPGDTLLLYTDGLIESSNEAGEHFGVKRLREHLRERYESPRALTDALYRSVAEYQDMDTLDDDVTFVTVEMKS